MQTNFSIAQLADPDIAEAEQILRACVHCGFCTATCPTYVLLGDELDSPRGRIYLIKDMLENDRPASDQVVRHVDRCLSCLACMTTCPSGVNYMHLVDHARRHIERTHTRPVPERLLRSLLAYVLPRPGVFRLSLRGATMARPFARALPGRLRRLVEMTPRRVSRRAKVDRPQTVAAEGTRRARVALLSSCAQQVLASQINEATIRLLTRHGTEVVIAEGMGCCGALVHHLGKEAAAKAQARANIDAWCKVDETGELDAIIVNASGCGTVIKDYGHMFRNDPQYRAKAARISALARDITEFMVDRDLAPLQGQRRERVTYHAACSMQHGQRVIAPPKQLLQRAGFSVSEPAESHLCCGSAGTYNLLQPELADRLGARKADNLAATKPDMIATGNIGCMTQIAQHLQVPVVHTVELLDWATGGPKPPALPD